MAITVSTTNPPRRGEPNGQHFTDYFPQVVAGASGNTLTLGASRVLGVRVSGVGATEITWSFSKPTLTINGLVDTKHYDIEVDYI